MHDRKKLIPPKILLLILSVIGLISCSQNSALNNPVDTPLVPDNINHGIVASADQSHYLLYDALIQIDPSDPENIQYEIFPLRMSSVHLNILKLLEDAPCTDCFKIVGFDIPEPGFLNVDIEITHPFPDPDLTAFDVRGIIMFDGSHVFPATGVTVSDSTLGDGELLNPDGYTSLYNASTFGSAPGPYTGYYEGNFSTPTMPDGDVNGYIRHISDDPSNTRNAFFAGDSDVSPYHLKIPSGPFVLGYAVDANWAPPISSPVEDPMQDFGLNANSPEPWKLDAYENPGGDGLTTGGGSTIISVKVYDWEGKTTYGSPRIECPELFSTPVSASWVVDNFDYSIFDAYIGNPNHAPAGEYLLLVSVEANENDPDLQPWMDLTAYQFCTVEVTGGEPGDYDPIAIAESDTDSQYIGNPITFDGSDSYDPDGGDIVKYEWQWQSGMEFLEGTAIQDHAYTNQGTFEVQLRVTDDDGQTDLLDQPLEITIYENPEDAIAQTWGGVAIEEAHDMAMDGSGDIYVVGQFNHTTDFDPGPGVFEKSPAGSNDVFLSKFSSDGIWQWTNTFGGTGNDDVTCVQIDVDGGVLVSGSFFSKVDFDPGPGKETRQSAGYTDAYVNRFDPNGNFTWVITWGGSSIDSANRLAVNSQGRINVAGSFAGIVDFDPGDGIDTHTSTNVDVFLIQFDYEGNYLWGYNWGSFDSINTTAIAVDSSNLILVLGQFETTVDFDPNEPVDNHTSNGGFDIYLVKYTSQGEYLETVTWGGAENEIANDVYVPATDFAFITGSFNGSVDFDPGDGTSFRTAGSSESDAYLSVLDDHSDFVLVRSWGGLGGDAGNGIWVAPNGNIFVVGTFSDTSDFDPTGGTDYRISNGETDAFMARFDSDGNYECVKTWGGTSIDQPVSLIYGSSTKVWISGFFRGDVDFDPGAGEEWHSAAGNVDSFLSKLPDGCD